MLFFVIAHNIYCDDIQELKERTKEI